MESETKSAVPFGSGALTNNKTNTRLYRDRRGKVVCVQNNLYYFKIVARESGLLGFKMLYNNTLSYFGVFTKWLCEAGGFAVLNDFCWMYKANELLRPATADLSRFYGFRVMCGCRVFSANRLLRSIGARVAFNLAICKLCCTAAFYQACLNHR